MSKINRSHPFEIGDVFHIDHTISKRCELSVFGSGVTLELSPVEAGNVWFVFTPTSTGNVVTFTTQAKRIRFGGASGYVAGPIISKE